MEKKWLEGTWQSSCLVSCPFCFAGYLHPKPLLHLLNEIWPNLTLRQDQTHFPQQSVYDSSPIPSTCVSAHLASHPSNKVTDKRETNPIFISSDIPDTASHSPPSTLLSRLFSLVSVPHTRGLIVAAGPEIHPSQASAVEELMWHFRGWQHWEEQQQRGCSGAFKGQGRVGIVLRGSPTTCDPDMEDDGGSRAQAAAWSPKPTVHSSIK